MIKIHSEIIPYNESEIKQVENTTDYVVNNSKINYELKVKKYEITKSDNISDNEFIESIKQEHLHLIAYLILRYRQYSNDTLEDTLNKIKTIKEKID